MGYFSNGTEGMMYRDRYCDKCANDINQDCPIWLAHLVYNYSKCNDDESILDLFIPPSEDRLSNKQCKMFRPIEEKDPELFRPGQLAGLKELQKA